MKMPKAPGSKLNFFKDIIKILIFVDFKGVLKIIISFNDSFLGISYTSQISTPCFKDAKGSFRDGINSWPTKPLYPVSTMAFIMAG